MSVPKGYKISDEARRNMIKAWDDPERRAKYRILFLARMKKRGMFKRRLYASKGGMANIDPDFDELGQ